VYPDGCEGGFGLRDTVSVPGGPAAVVQPDLIGRDADGEQDVSRPFGAAATAATAALRTAIIAGAARPAP